MGIAINIEPAAGKQIASAVKIEHKQPTYYNPISTRIQDLDEDNVEQAQEGTAAYGKTVEDWKVEPVEAQEAVLYTNEEVDAYNATLDGAVKAGDSKPVEPAEEEPKVVEP